MQEIADWLQTLGMPEYAQRFAENGIEFAALRHLTDQDLKDIGVLLGHRRIMLAAIQEFGNPAGAQPVTAESKPQDTAERRQVTVMFSDLVGSTALSARMDPEDLREVISAYQKSVTETVNGFGGFVAKYMGDGVLVYFGYPRAHEDDAERAVRAGMALVAAVRDLKTHTALQTRVGIATGLVVVGDLIGSGASHEQAIIGETPNLAARLQGVAEPNSVVIAESTRKLLGNLFELEELGSRELKGISGAIGAWAALRPASVESRFEAFHAGGVTKLVGRDEELDLLMRRWHQASSGEGQVVLISGEPGIGKSRLAAALSEAIEGEPLTRVRYFCSPLHQDSALYPFISQLERVAGFAHDDTAVQKLGKLRGLLASGARGNDEIELLAELLSLPSSAADLNLSPQRKRQKLFEAFLHQLQALARAQPVLMVFEDAHWIDPSSRELLGLIFDQVPGLGVLLVVTFRPEFEHGWSGQSHASMLALNRIGEGDGAALVERLAGNAGLSHQIVEDIVERADGVPLFLEELTKAVIESADRGNRVDAVLRMSPLPNLAIPPTLHASLMARLDRLGPVAKEVAQVGAVIGREFAYELIAPVARRPEKELQTALDHLGDSGLLFCQGTAPHASYLFKHALVQDAAYSTLLRRRRQELHAGVAAALEEHFADLVERQPELLAHHLTAAGDTERAVDQWLKAGRYTAARLAYLEAIAHFEQGLGLLHSLPEGSVRNGREIELQLALGLCLFSAKGAVAAKPPYARAHELAETSGEPQQRFEALYGVWQSTMVSGGITAARPLSERLLRLAEREGDDELRLQAHHSGWSTLAYGGDPAKALEHADAGRRLYDLERHASHRFVYGGHDPGPCAGWIGAHAEWLLGYPEKALASITDSLALCERIAHPFTLSIALSISSLVYLNRREPERALCQLEAAELLAAEQRLSLIFETGMLRGAALAEQGAIDEAIARIREGVTKWTRLGRTFLLPYGLAFLAQELARHGDQAAALAALREGLALAEATGEHFWDAELHRLTGAVLLAENKLDEAGASIQRAIHIAQAQQAKSLELRATASLARLWRDQGKLQQARELLAPLYGWFTEGFDTRDLKDAKALLDELAT
jgi:class 3 adenylate cyclase/predicted ATPase